MSNFKITASKFTSILKKNGVNLKFSTKSRAKKYLGLQLQDQEKNVLMVLSTRTLLNKNSKFYRWEVEGHQELKEAINLMFQELSTLAQESIEEVESHILRVRKEYYEAVR